MIRISKLDKYFNKGKPNEIHVINEASIEFGDTGLVCILGESGSGKTTFLNTVGGLDTYQKGSITVDGTTLTRYSGMTERLRNSKYAYIFQEHYLLQDHTVAYNIRLAMSNLDMTDEEKEARLDYVLQAVDMKKYKKRLVFQLSGGQQQRVAIARALVKAPEVIFADEPTGNLDEANTMRVMSILKKISKECLVILVTHEKRIAEFFADRIIHIKDGRIIEDIGQEGKNIYKYSDDANLYLKEFRKEELGNDTISIDFYDNGEKGNLKLMLVYTDGKLYIQAPEDVKAVYLTPDSEIQMVDDVKPVLEIRQVEELDYSLPKAPAGKSAKLPFREIYRLAKTNVVLLGRKQIFMVASLIITAFLLVTGLASYTSTAAIDKESVITEDSHYIMINAKRNVSSTNTQFYESFNEIFNQFVQSNIAEDIYIDLNTKISFIYSDFRQIRNYMNVMPEASFVTLDHLKKEDLILGRMPENRNEIVVDRWVIDLLLKEDIISNLMTIDDFVGLDVIAGISNNVMKITGICDTGERSIYIDKYLGISLATWADTIASLEQLQAQYPGQYDDIKLKENEALVSQTIYNNMKSKGETVYTAKNGISYNVVGCYPDTGSFNVSYVVNDAYYRNILYRYICMARKFMVYCEDKKPVLNYFDSEAGGYDNTYVEMLVSDTYNEELSAYKAERAVKLNAQTISTGALFIISMFMLYFTMKSNAIKRVEELTVYRLMGITKRSVLTAFALEICLITSYTMLPVILIASGIIKLLAAMPSMEISLIYPWYCVGLLLVFVYAVNTIVGLMPVYHIIKLPPAQLAAKAD